MNYDPHLCNSSACVNRGPILNPWVDERFVNYTVASYYYYYLKLC